MRSQILSVFLVLIILAFLTACSKSNDSSPQLCDLNPQIDSSGHGQTDNSGSRMLWGFYEIGIDTRTGEANIVPIRTAEFGANVTRFMQPPISPVSRIKVYVDLTGGDISNGLFAVDVTLNHPFPGLSMYSGFDVRGIFMADGSVESNHYGGLIYADADESHLTNPDGWTRWWNPTEFTTLNTLFGYTKGIYASPGFTATATLNPYKYFADELGSEDPFILNPENRGFFSTMPGTNTRRYMIQFKMDSGSPVVKFNYAVDASWEAPDPGGAPDYEQSDYAITANSREAYQVTVADAGSTAWFVSGTENGGDLAMDIYIYDWQALENPEGVPGEISAIWLESPNLQDEPDDVLPWATVSPDGPTTSDFHVEIADVTPSGLEDQTIMIAVESADPTDYAPQIDGITGFAYPDAPLATFTFWDAPIIGESPIEIPAPTGLDNCAAAGVVKLFWDAVDWPTLAGYNVYRKLSTQPSFDFDNPLNSTLITETFYLDTDVLMNGTTYDYVVTAVDADSSESDPSNQTSATPVYNTPTGFTDLNNPDGKMGSVNVSNIINAQITVDGTVYLVWDFGPWFVRGNIDGTYGSDVYLGSSTPNGQDPNVAVDSQGNAHVVWTNQYSSSRAYYYATITPGNAIQNFTTLHTFTATSGWDSETCIVVTPDDEIHIVLVSNDGSVDLIYIHGHPGSWSSPEVLTHDVYGMEYHVRPDLQADSEGNLHLVWTSASMKINYMKRTPDGSWSSPIIASGGLSGWSNFSDVAVDYRGIVHVTWNYISPSAQYQAAYSDNHTGTFQAQIIPGSNSENLMGVACDPDGNSYVDWWDGAARVNVAMFDINGNLIEQTPVNDDLPYEGAWCTFAGITDPCFDDNVSVMAFWKEFPYSPPPLFARIQTDY